MIFFLSGVYSRNLEPLAIALVDENRRSFFWINNEAKEVDFPLLLRHVLPKKNDQVNIKSLAWRSRSNLNVEIAAYILRGPLDHSKLDQAGYKQLFDNHNYLLWNSIIKEEIVIVTSDIELVGLLSTIFKQDFPVWFPRSIRIWHQAKALNSLDPLEKANLMHQKYYFSDTVTINNQVSLILE